ncbi:hypothetical protein EHW97_14835 [Aeromicrobium camelliae]|uniref:Uncharacterized protein n=1 Tax=Aeromicrobium camelliae TaxID=1538144 RepID=A0A3N6WK30_9ACTN|nr:hypothetical protein [Aeromicrobium camelliae]RQN02028.1 hypothetical protein EHW97_14835 [Aeromicrobium camelliae]
MATNDALDADVATGRNLRTSQTVAAARVGRSERTIRRARAVSVRLGVLVELYRGRELSGEERLALYDEKPGHGQRGYPNVYAVTVCPTRQRRRITIPRPGRYARVLSQSQGFGHLPPLGGVSLESNVIEIFPLADADASREAESAPPTLKRRRRRPGIGLAYRTLNEPAIAGLLRDVRPGAAAAMFAAHDRGGWTGAALANALRDEADRRHIAPWTNVHSPYGLLKMLLTSVDVDAHAYFTLGIAPDALPIARAAEPCGSDDCDGFGWINLTINGVDHARPCPHCPPEVRRG